MTDTHSAHLVELSMIREYRQALQTTAMLEVGMRHALLDALDRWQRDMPLQFFLCVICPNGHVTTELCSESKLEDTVLRALGHMGDSDCAWPMDFISDRAKMIWEDTVDLYDFMVCERPPGVTLH